MRPKSILLFEKLLLGSTALVVLNLLLHYGRLRDDAIADGTSPAGPFLGIVLAVAVNLLLWFFIARRASTFTKWVMVVLMVLALIGFAADYPAALEIGFVYVLWSAINLGLQAAALAMLFRRDAAEWLRSKGRTLDPRIFE